MRSGHVAVWLGASVGADDWVQAGIEDTYGTPGPLVYAETGTNGRGHFIDLGTYEFGQEVHVRLRHKGRMWTIYVNGRIVATKVLSSPTLLATGESWQDEPNDYVFRIRP